MDPQRLAELPLFVELSDDQLGGIAACTRAVSIAEGEADVRRDGDVIAWVGQGDVIGEIGLLVTGTRTASIVARTPMTLVAMFAREFKQVERQTPAVADRLREIMRERVARTGYQSR